jgi:integrase
VAKLNLTVKTVASLKPGPTRQDYFDAGVGAVPGFHVRVTPAGEKTFSVLYRYYGKLRRLTIGGVEKIGLAAARKKAKDAIRDASNGVDPAQEKIKERLAETFGDLADAYITRHASTKRSGREDTRILNKYLLPKLRHVRAKDVQRAQVREIIENLAQDAPIMANRVLAVVRKAYNWGIEKDLVELNPCHKLTAPSEEHERDRVLTDDEIKAVWKALDNSDHIAVADTYKLRLLTAQRATEVMGMRWDELDLDAQWWVIPKERSKNKRAHLVWLNDPARRIIRKAKARNDVRKKRSGGPSPWVFPGKRKGKHLTEPKRVFADILEASGVKGWRGHDLRRTCSTAMTRDLKIPRFIVSRVLNHSEEKNVTGKHYDLYDYRDEKKDALERWGARVAMITSDLKAVASDGPDQG